jgi:hypothetical protein
VRPTAGDSGTLLELRLADLTRHSLRALGSETVPADLEHDALEAPRAWGVVAKSGAIEELRFPVLAPKPFREVMTKLVEQMQVTPADGVEAEWTAVEPGPNGRAVATYHADGLSLTRVRERYDSLSVLADGACSTCGQQLADHAEITLDPRGVVASIEDHESIRLPQRGAPDALYAVNAFSLRLIGLAPAQGDLQLASGETDSRTPGDRAPMTSRDEQQILESEARGFAPAQLDYAIDLFAKKGEHPPDKTWLVHARAYLRLHPEALDALGRKLQGTTERGRSMIFQLLAVTGSPRAQEIMRASLDAAKRAEPPETYGHLVQKLAIVDRPTAETTAYVQDAYRTARLHGDQGSALSEAATLGGIASKLAKAGDGAGARNIVAGLDADLRAARDPEEKRGLVLALRNAGAADQDAVRSLAYDESAEVRAEVARSLTDAATPTARATLDALVTDDQLSVSSTALLSLGHDQPTQGDVHAIASAVLGSQTPATLDGYVMDFFSGNLDSPDALPVLSFLLERTKNPVLARRLRLLIEQIAT